MRVRLMANRLIRALLILVIVAGLGGCGFGTVEDMLSPPRLTDEQSAIYRALTDSKGSGFKLKYPRSGEHRSAFVIYSDDDSAIVFYEISGINTERSLWINFLYKDGRGNWESLHDLPITGVDIESVSFVSFGEDESEQILLSYIVNQNEKGFMVITHNGKTPVKQHEHLYSYMAVDYFFEKERKELLVIYNAMATFYNFKDGQLVIDAWCALDPNAGEYVDYLQGDVTEGVPALFINHRKSDNAAHYGTDILHYSGRRLVNPMILNPANIAATLRITNAVTELANPRDIDGSGIVRLSSGAGEFPGYADVPAHEKLRPAIWRSLIGENLEETYYSYYSESLNYVFFLPGRWHNNVTAKVFAEDKEVGFYRAGQPIGEIGDEQLLLSIRAMFEGDENPGGDWVLLAENPVGTRYYITIPDPENPLALTPEELELAFRILSEA
ncbi:MAG: hypothetical protein FWH20_06100 [Oscillospiraceae bacterium]|nr:hypothetical protein [Oscillospiraceae bacterium]